MTESVSNCVNVNKFECYSYENNAWQVSIDEVKERQNRLAKMRSLLFRHEMKAKHIKKIKSKTYHRLLKKDRLKAASAEMQMDPEAAKEQAMKQEFKRAEVIGKLMSDLVTNCLLFYKDFSSCLYQRLDINF